MRTRPSCVDWEVDTAPSYAMTAVSIDAKNKDRRVASSYDTSSGRQ